LYIAMTRANAGLWIAMNQNLQDFISTNQSRNQEKNMQQLMSGDREGR